MSDRPQLTTAAGNPVGDNQNSLSAGPRGPLLMQDHHLLEKMSHFNRERIPERVVHAKGSGAYGTLTITNDITRFSSAKVFSEVGKKTGALLRFSTVAGERGAADAERDVRGFALKFYTEEGNWDLVGNNTPVFFIRDPLKFSDFIHTQKRDPKTNLRNPAAMWDFWSHSPAFVDQGPDHPQGEIAGAAVFQDVMQAKLAIADRERRGLHLRKGLGMGVAEDIAPVDEDVVFQPSLGRLVRLGADQNQGLLEKGLDLQARHLAGLVHDADVQQTIGQLAHLTGGVVGIDPQGHIGQGPPHPRDPRQDQAIPEAHLGGERDDVAVALGQGHALIGLAPGVLQVQGVAAEALAGAGQLDARAEAAEERQTEVVFQCLDTRAHRRLSDVETLRSPVKIARGRHLQKGANVVEVHSASDVARKL